MVSSVLQPEKIIGKQKPTKEQALKFVSGGSSLGSSILSSAKNKIVNFDRAKVSAKPNNLQTLISNLSSTVFNTTNTIQNIFGNKETKEKKNSKFFGGFFDKFKEALAFITFFGAKKNLDRVKENIDNLKTTFVETFDVAKALRKAILKIIEQISGLSGGGGGGGIIGAIMSALGGLAAGLVPQMGGRRPPNIAGPAMKQEGNLLSKIPKGLKGGGGGIGKLLLGGTAALGAGAAVSGLSQPGGEDVQPGDTTPEVPGNVLDRFNSILDRFDKILDGMKGKPGKSSGESSSSGSSSKPASPGASPGGSPAGGGGGQLISGPAPKEINSLMSAISGAEGGIESVNTIGEMKGLSEMTIDQAIAKVQTLKNEGKTSGAMGRMQHMSQYLRKRAIDAGLDPSTAKFNQENQYKIDRSFLAGQFKGGEQEIVNLMKSGKITDVVAKLRGIWPSLPGGSQENMHTSAFYKRLENFLSKSGVQLPQTPTKPGQQAPQAPSASKSRPQPIVIPFQQQSQVQPASSGGGGKISAPPSPQQNGPTTPFYPSSNYDNFLTLYSRMVYNIVDG
jgi:muramidase (phage lysozyme)